MRSLGTRRAFLATGVATVAAIALTGCSAGQVAETALKRTSNPGVNVDNSDRTVSIRNLTVQYPGVTGYAAGANAPLELGIYNQTKQPVTVMVSSRPSADQANRKGLVSARQVGLVGGAAAKPSAPTTAIPEPSGSRPPATELEDEGEQVPSADASAPAPGQTPSTAPAAPAAAARPARIEIAPLGSVTFQPGDTEQLTAIGLTGKLMPGNALTLVFEFSNGAQPLVVQAPVSIPLSPASRGPAVPGEHAESEEQDNTHE
ncbi:hypothetical protein [Couchioplanes azureus]|uniref:hypothetical protein n=1 Tax=Couchioplanes caeruleus TaxID=56438 RepID=UPI001670292E|nr:hypothetical protein [Couchioplanes caeruleus]GGQ43257.1 hypothetical protein GCM10010166_09480 [Couchioplanes caeruleus subsp. azureus]